MPSRVIAIAMFLLVVSEAFPPMENLTPEMTTETSFAEAESAAAATPPKITKMGLVCSNGYMFKEGNGCTSKHLKAFVPSNSALVNSEGAKWYYNYEPSLPAEMKKYLNTEQVEFVPMVGWRHFWLNPPGYEENSKCAGKTNKCDCYMNNLDLTPETGKPPDNAEGNDSKIKCDVGGGDLEAILKQTMNGLTGKAKPKYLMGFNEPEDTHFKHKNISPQEAVYYWRYFLQPVAKKLGLKLITPTVNNGFCKDHSYGCQYMGTWLAKFLQKCYDARDDKEYPCDVDQIKGVSYHGYECFEKFWTDKFTPGTGTFIKDMKTQMKGYGGDGYNWDNWVDSRKLWVTEFNCNNDGYGSLDFKGTMLLASMKEICERIEGKAKDVNCKKGCPRKDGSKVWGPKDPDTGKRVPYEWGKGSVQALQQSDYVERFSWWNTWNPGKSTVASARVLNARLVDDDGKPYAQGLALQKGLTSSCDEGAPPPDYTQFCKEWCIDKFAAEPECQEETLLQARGSGKTCPVCKWKDESGKETVDKDGPCSQCKACL